MKGFVVFLGTHRNDRIARSFFVSSFQLDFSEFEYFENNIKVNIFSLQKNVEKILKPGKDQVDPID